VLRMMWRLLDGSDYAPDYRGESGKVSTTRENIRWHATCDKGLETAESESGTDMAPEENLKRGMRDVKRAMKAAAREAKRHSDDQDMEGINVSFRSNVSVAKNVGAHGSVEEVSPSQHVGQIHQINVVTGGETTREEPESPG